MRLHAEVSGPADGPVVVFLHGVSGSSRAYAWLPEELTRGRRIVKVDLRGHGRSEHVGSYRIGDYGEDVVDLLRDVADGPAVLVGHSLGGVIAWWVAQRHPELVAAAFLEDPPLYMGEPAEHERNGAVPVFRGILDIAARWKADGVSVEEAATELADARFGPPTFDEAPVAFAYALLAMDPGVLEGAVDRSTLADTDTSSPVAVPVFILAADEAVVSAFPERHAERLAQTHPDVEVVRVSGAGHGIHDEIEHRAVYVDHVARFLATHADGG